MNLHWVSLGVRQSSMKVFLLTAVSVLTTAYGMEWSFEGANPLRSDDGGATLTGSVSVKKNAGISGNALYFDGKKDFLELRLTESNRPRREMTISYWLKPDLGCTLFPIVRAPSRDVEFSGNSGFYWFGVHTADGHHIYNGCAHPQRLRSGEWHHFALVYDQTGIATYLNGKLVGRAESAKAPGELRFSGGPWRIGGKLDESGGRPRGFFQGVLDDFKVLPVAIHAFPEVEKTKLQQQLNAAGLHSVAELEKARKHAMITKFGASAARLPFSIAAVSALERLLPDDLYLFTGEIGKPVKFKAAANERENRQLLILPYGGNNLDDVTVGLPEILTDANGNSKPFNFKISRIEYTVLPKPSPFMYPLKRIPDKLITGNTFNIPGDVLAPLWLEVFVPTGTPGGIYRGALTITAPGNPSLELPVEVKVWNFELPQRNIAPSLVNVWERDLQTYVKPGDVDGFINLLDAYCMMLLEHRLNPIVLAHNTLVAPWIRKAVYPDYRIENDSVVANMETFDRLIAKYRREGLSKVAVGPHYHFPSGKISERQQKIQSTQPEKIWNFVQEHARQQGYLDDAVAYPIDEPENNTEYINYVTGMMKRSAPQIPLLLTSGGANYPDPAIHDVDIWVPILHWTNREQHKKERAMGKPVWTYVCTGPNYPMPNLHSDTPPCGVRMTAIGAVRFDYDGFLHWAANFITYKNAPSNKANAFAAGEGTYIYADAYGRPVPTVRLKSLADGMEDWTMLLMLKEQNPKAYAAIRKKLEALMPERKYDPTKPMTMKLPREGSFHTFLDNNTFFPIYDQPELWLKLRDEIGETLSR